MKQIYLVRHGQSTSNAGGEAQPNAQIELTELGQQQVAEVADWLEKTLGDSVDAVHFSRFIRTQQTAQPYIDKVGIEPNLIEGLQEFDYLSFNKTNGTTFATRLQMAEEYWLRQDPRHADGEDAESFHEFCERVEGVLEHFKALPDGKHVVFTHGLWMSMLIWQILGQPCVDNRHLQKFRQFELSIRPRNCEVFLLTLSEENIPAITKVRTCADTASDVHAT